MAVICRNPTRHMDELNRDFREFIALLEARQVDYLVVGGYAVGLHGFPRYTGDLDFFVAINDQNAAKLLEVFNDFGFGDIGLQHGDFLESDSSSKSAGNLGKSKS